MTRWPMFVLLVLLAPAAAAFGTVSGLGQSAEHEAITRAALRDVLAPETLDMLTGRRGSFGAVGAPDRPDRGMLTESDAHCDNGDHLDVPDYPQSAREARWPLEGCKTWIGVYLADAVQDAGRIVLSAEGGIVRNELPTTHACIFNGVSGRAKCDVLESLGIALHAAQDFYAHSNWTDQAASGPITALNPPGLAQAGPVPWLDLRQDVPFPAGLISGCFMGVPESMFCAYDNGTPRVRHEVLSKDTGPIDPVSGAAGEGTTPRGAINGNFARAVAAATLQTTDIWMLFEEQVRAKYGEARGDLIICAMRNDLVSSCT